MVVTVAKTMFTEMVRQAPLHGFSAPSAVTQQTAAQSVIKTLSLN